MDNGLVLKILRDRVVIQTVLILVVVDNGLVLMTKSIDKRYYICLNPCCSGQWSRTINVTVEVDGKFKS